MIKKILALFLAIFCFFAFSGCSHPASYDSPRYYYDSDYEEHLFDDYNKFREENWYLYEDDDYDENDAYDDQKYNDYNMKKKEEFYDRIWY